MLVKSGNWSTVPWSNIRVYVRFFMTRTTGFFYVCVLCVCVCGGGVIVQGAPEGSTGRLIFVVAVGKACA